MNKTEYKNKYKSEKYDRIELAVPKGEKDKIKQIAAELNVSVNEYLYNLFKEDLVLRNNKPNEPKVLTEDMGLLEKWQVPKKYYEMIEECSYSEENGYFIRLKPGYINDATNTRIINCHKTSELRTMIPKSHEVRKVDPYTEMIETLQKWQIPQKYYEMIESIGDKEITLKNGYMNEISGGKTIKVNKLSEFRSIMKYTREI